MSQEKSNVVAITEAAGQQSQQAKPAKSKPTQTLPTDRVVFNKHLSLLRAYAAASGHNTKAVKLAEVADIAKISAPTISQANGFFLDVGLLQKTEGGFVPAQEVMAFAKAHEWSPATASHKLAPVMGQTWFAQQLLRKLAFDPKMKEADAIAELAQAAGAGREYTNQVKVLIDYLEASGIVAREGDYLRKPTGQPSTPAAPIERATQAHPTEHKEVQHREPAAARSNVSTAFTQMTGGRVQFNISVNVDMAEFSGWTPDRITAFFAGIAQVLAAKGAVEQKANIESLE